MKDIDFDELDRAVSSALSPRQAPIKQAEPITESEVQAPLLPVQDSSQPDEPSHEDTTSSREATATSTRSEAPQRPAQPVIVPHRSGRFMEMVSASAGTKTAKNVLAKVEDEPTTAVSPTEDVKTLPRLTIEPIQADTTTQTPKHEMLDTLTDTDKEDNNDSNKNDDIKSANDDTAADHAPLKDWDLPPTQDDAQTKTMETPFLPDTKVEKRPLGAFSDTVESDSPDTAKANPVFVELNDASTPMPFHATRIDLNEENDTTSLLDDVAAAKEITQKPEEINYIPPELGQDVVAVEADTAAENAKKLSQTKPVTSATQPSTMTASSLVSAAAAMSIPKQYNEKTELDSKAGPSLFDTKEYHPPLTKYGDSHTQKHTALWVIVALLLLIATAAGFGYWLYLQI